MDKKQKIDYSVTTLAVKIRHLIFKINKPPPLDPRVNQVTTELRALRELQTRDANHHYQFTEFCIFFQRPSVHKTPNIVSNIIKN